MVVPQNGKITIGNFTYYGNQTLPENMKDNEKKYAKEKIEYFKSKMKVTKKKAEVKDAL